MFSEALRCRSWTRVAALPNRFSGLPTTRPSWPQAAPTGGSTCGTSARSARSSRRRTARTVLPSSWSVSTNTLIAPSLATSPLASQVTTCPVPFPISSSTADTRPRSQTSRGTPTSRGSSAPFRRTTSCKCGRWWELCMIMRMLFLILPNYILLSFQSICWCFRLKTSTMTRILKVLQIQKSKRELSLPLLSCLMKIDLCSDFRWFQVNKQWGLLKLKWASSDFCRTKEPHQNTALPSSC